jgi:hypothetical protein
MSCTQCAGTTLVHKEGLLVCTQCGQSDGTVCDFSAVAPIHHDDNIGAAISYQSRKGRSQVKKCDGNTVVNNEDIPISYNMAIYKKLTKVGDWTALIIKHTEECVRLIKEWYRVRSCESGDTTDYLEDVKVWIEAYFQHVAEVKNRENAKLAHCTRTLAAGFFYLYMLDTQQPVNYQDVVEITQVAMSKVQSIVRIIRSRQTYLAAIDNPKTEPVRFWQLVERFAYRYIRDSAINGGALDIKRLRLQLTSAHQNFQTQQITSDKPWVIAAACVYLSLKDVPREPDTLCVQSSLTLKALHATLQPLVDELEEHTQFLRQIQLDVRHLEEEHHRTQHTSATEGCIKCYHAYAYLRLGQKEPPRGRYCLTDPTMPTKLLHYYIDNIKQAAKRADNLKSHRIPELKQAIKRTLPDPDAQFESSRKKQRKNELGVSVKQVNIAAIARVSNTVLSKTCQQISKLNVCL